MDTRNGETRHVLSLPCAGAGDRATCRDGVGCPKTCTELVKVSQGLGSCPGYADVGRVTGKVRVLAKVAL